MNHPTNSTSIHKICLDNGVGLDPEGGTSR
jgi:hypothetical protein